MAWIATVPLGRCIKAMENSVTRTTGGDVEEARKTLVASSTLMLTQALQHDPAFTAARHPIGSELADRVGRQLDQYAGLLLHTASATILLLRLPR